MYSGIRQVPEGYPRYRSNSQTPHRAMCAHRDVCQPSLEPRCGGCGRVAVDWLGASLWGRSAADHVQTGYRLSVTTHARSPAETARVASPASMTGSGQRYSHSNGRQKIQYWHDNRNQIAFPESVPWGDSARGYQVKGQ